MGACAGRTRDLFEFSRVHSVSLGNGETYAYRELPTLHHEATNKVMLFLHPYTLSSMMLNTGGLLQQLSHFTQDYRIIACDFRGNGNSSHNKRTNSLYDLADDLKLFLDKKGIKKVTLLGVSMGGMIANLFAIRHPTYVTSVILIGAASITGGYGMFSTEPGYPKTADDILETKAYKATAMDLKTGNTPNLKNFYENLHPKKFVGAENFDLLLEDVQKTKNTQEMLWGMSQINLSSKSNGFIDGSGDVKKITAPILVIHGELDTVVSHKEIQLLREELPKADLTVVIVEGAHHFCWLDNLEASTLPIRDFIERHHESNEKSQESK